MNNPSNFNSKVPKDLTKAKKMYQLKTIYKIDITIEDQALTHYVNGKKVMREDRTAFIVKRVRKALRFCNFNYDIRMEYSSPEHMQKASMGKTQPTIPRIHFHGLILFPTTKSLYSFYNIDCLRLIELGRIEIDTIEDHLIWSNYITKDETLMTLICLEQDIEYPLKFGF